VGANIEGLFLLAKQNEKKIEVFFRLIISVLISAF
jgi:hypothetical protein